ncbi:MAG: hypothetical protein BWY53_00577 [Parcubacteria group bacterium ADurb.Bin326]|nr:MAG: hypothetical protein BWY53_00577 [Parcubacteria group bacterium ADurb.Bin326]
MKNTEKEVDFKKQEKLAKVVKAVISAGIITPAAMSLFGCEGKEPVAETIVETSQAPETTSAPTTTVVETTQTTLEKEARMEDSEFEPSMIKHRLTFPAGIPKGLGDIYEWYKEGQLVPMWYVGEYLDNYKGTGFYASGVVAGNFRKEIGESGKEELLLPVAFENYKTGKYYVRDISFGNEEYIQNLDQYDGWWDVRVLEDYEFIGGRKDDGKVLTGLHSNEFFQNYKIGDQVSFAFLNKFIILAMSEAEYFEKMETNSFLKINYEFSSKYWANNKVMYEAIKNNEDLPNIKIHPDQYHVNKLEE